MKFNWGKGILITVILIFLGVIAFFIYISNLDINLVEDNYYEKELAYQAKIDEMKNTDLLPEKINISYSPDQVKVKFPAIFHDKQPQGTILFYRPSDPARDFNVSLQLSDSGLQIIEAGSLLPGKWIVKIDWSLDSVKYYQEEVFIK
jgi:nitrogen fixation protein FixH